MKIRLNKYGEMEFTAESDKEIKQIHKIMKKTGGSMVVPKSKNQLACAKPYNWPIRFYL